MPAPDAPRSWWLIESEVRFLERGLSMAWQLIRRVRAHFERDPLVDRLAAGGQGDD